MSLQYFSKIDAFGIRPSLLISSKSKYQTYFGATLSIILVVIILISFYILGKELFEKTSPSVNLSTEYVKHPMKLNFIGNYEFLVSLQNNKKVPEVDESIYYTRAFVTDIVSDGKGGTTTESKELVMETCDKVMKQSKYAKEVENFTLHNFYCLSLNQGNNSFGTNNDDLYINDSWGNIGFRMIQIKFYECDNKLTPGKCKPKEEIDDFLKNSTLTYFSFDNFIQTSNYSHPISSGLKEYFYYPSNTFYLAITHYFRHVTIVSDDGIVFNSYSNQTTYKHDRMFHYEMNYRDRPNFISLSFQLVNERDGYDRKYYKIPDLAGQIGGIYKAVYLILIIISHFYNQNSMYENLFNHFFEIEGDETQEKDQDLNEILGINDSERGKEKKEKVYQLHDKNKEIKLIHHNKQEKIKLSFCRKFMLLSCCPFNICRKQTNKGLMLYLNGKTKICSYLETSNYLLKIHQVDMIKNILKSNSNKMTNYEYIFTPVLSFNEEKGRYSVLYPDDESENELK